jgi:hypothetical protein
MSFWSGNTGGVTVNGGAELNVGKWEVRRTARTVENTHSGTGGSTNFNLVVYHAEWTIEIPWDDTNLPDTDMGFVPGTQLSALVFQHGNSGKTISIASTMVEEHVTINDPQNDIVRSRVSGRGGVLTPPVT